MRLGLGLGLTNTRRTSGGGGSPPASLVYGFNASVDLGSTGNVFVDKMSGSDANAGTNFGAAKATLAAGMALATSGQTVRVIGDGVSYRELLTMKAGVTVKGYGTHKPILSAGELLTGWTVCTGADAAVLGSLTPGNIWKITGFAKSNIAGGLPHALNIHEAGAKSLVCRTWGLKQPDMPQFADNTQGYLDVTTNVASTFITGWVLPAELAALTAPQMAASMLRFVSDPNGNRTDFVASYDAGTRTITPVGTGWVYENNGNKDKLSATNVIPLMRKGEWGFIDNGTTIDIYMWPNSTANLAAGIEYAARDMCVDLSNVSDIGLEGFVLRMASSASTNPADGGHALSGNSPTERSNVTLKHFKITDTERVRAGYACVDIRATSNLVVSDCTIDEAVGQFGFYVRGSVGSTDAGTVGLGWTPATGITIARNVIRRTESGPFRVYSSRDCAIFDNYCEYNGIGPHSNKISIYQQCHNVLLFRNRFRGANGYITWQESSDICLVGNDMVVSYNTDDAGNLGRGIEDQNSDPIPDPLKPGKQTPTGFDPTWAVAAQGSVVLNNRVLPFDAFSSGEFRSVGLGKSTQTTVNFTVYNNIMNGAANTAVDRMTAHDRNYYTNGTLLAGVDANSVLSDSASTYTDHLNGDFSFKAGASVRSMAGQDVSAIITALAARFPQVTDWTKDLAGNTVNWTAPKVGPFQNLDNLGTWPVQRIRWPVISGVTVLGSTLTGEPGWIEADPFPTQTFQWYRSTDRVTWTAISGANSLSYTLVSADIGYYHRWTVTSGTDVASDETTELVISVYPIADPVVLKVHGDTTSGTFYSTLASGTFSATNKPILITVYHQLAAAADTPQDVTIGVHGGSRIAVPIRPLLDLGRRGNSQISHYFIAAPGTGAFTVEVTSSATSGGVRILVEEWAGATGLGAFAPTGATGSTRKPTATSTALNSMMRYSGAKASGATEVLTITNATQNDQGNTGGNSSGDAACASGWELASAIASYDCDITATASGAFVATALEILS